jgi:hypothetical protein
MQQIVKITIEAGTPTIHVQGVKGRSCKDITKALEAALGETSESKSTNEFYEQANQAVKAGR